MSVFIGLEEGTLVYQCFTVYVLFQHSLAMMHVIFSVAKVLIAIGVPN